MNSDKIPYPTNSGMSATVTEIISDYHVSPRLVWIQGSDSVELKMGNIGPSIFLFQYKEFKRRIDEFCTEIERIKNGEN